MMKFVIRKGRDGQYYWRAKHNNGNIVADGGEGYTSASNARRAVNRFVNAAADGQFVIEHDE